VDNTLSQAKQVRYYPPSPHSDKVRRDGGAARQRQQILDWTTVNQVMLVSATPALGVVLLHFFFLPAHRLLYHFAFGYRYATACVPAILLAHVSCMPESKTTFPHTMRKRYTRRAIKDFKKGTLYTIS